MGSPIMTPVIPDKEDSSVHSNTSSQSNDTGFQSQSAQADAPSHRAVSSPLNDVSNFQRQHQSPAYRRSIASQLNDASLADVSSITIEFDKLPRYITTRDIHNSLKKYRLNITKIDILEKISGEKIGKARVTIEPAPTTWPPWNGPQNFFTITRERKPPVQVRVGVSRVTKYGSPWQTPLRNTVPREIRLKSRGLLFGMMANENTMFKMPQYNYQGVCLTVQFYRRFLEITFNVDLVHFGIRPFKIPIKFSHIKKIIRTNHEDGTWALAIILPNPPEVFSRITDDREIQESHDDDLSFWQERDLWVRQVEISSQLHKAKRLPAKLEKEHASVNIGRWTTYYLHMETHFLHLWEDIEPRLTDYNIKVELISDFHLTKPSQTNFWTLLRNPAPSMSLELLSSSQNIHLPFEIQYQLEACISQGLFNEYKIDIGFLEKLKTFDSERARMMLEGVSDGNAAYYEPMEIFEEPKILNYWPSAKIPPNAAMIRKVIITPTTIYLKTPSVELTNRVLRKFSDLNDRFLRVQFTDELTFSRIWSDQGSKKSDELYTRVHRVLRNGLIVGGRHYELLAWSNSQFREHGAFFFCPNDHVTCDTIRDWMGDLKHIRSVGKFAARMGQCFTTTRQVSGISIPRIRPIPDIERRTTDGKVWNFTDGIGKISPFIVDMITHEQNLIDTPSCLQVRMGGCKGVLTVWPDVPPNEVHIRPSQEKFKGPYNGIETIKVSKYSHATLNKQIIPILSCLGVKDEVFMELLEEELKDYSDAMSDPVKAAELLRNRVDENQITLVMAEMVGTFMDTGEPFLRTLLDLWKCWALQRLKQKAAISIKKSAFLYGCVDEAGVLRGHSKKTEGTSYKDVGSLPQIFLQIPINGTQAPNSTKYRVVTGLCVVGRNPSLHPGDIRVVQAVDRPELRHLKDIVVFPQVGDRDIPSMCSGGDLDGDDFFVLWDERLIPEEWNHKPMDHDIESSTPGIDELTGVTMEHASGFFAQYMKNDSLGLIATAHLAWADKVGPKDPKCIELAQLHSKAVDYVKSGSPAMMHKRLNAKSFPHFMERNTKTTYRSDKPLGRIYDRVAPIKFDPVYDMAFDDRIASCYLLSAQELTKAREVKNQYDIAMRRLIGRHENPVTEFEIWSTFVLSKPRVGSDYKLQEEVGRDVAALKDRFRSICAEAIMGVEQKSIVFSYSMIDLKKLDRFVAAMYTVTRVEVQAALRERALPQIDENGNKIADDQGADFMMPLISFPWLFHRELVRIASGGRPPVRQWTSSEQNEAVTQPAASPDGLTVELGSEQVVSKEGGEVGADENEDYVRTSSGQVVHRGEILDLFNANGEVVKHSRAYPVVDHGVNVMSSSHIDSEPQSTYEPNLVKTHESTKFTHEENDDCEGFHEVEFEEMEMEDEEDVLDVLAKKIASI